MSLEACPVCGYAVSTVTSECRHCSGAQAALPRFQQLNAVSFVVTVGAATGAVIYILFFH